VRRRWLDGERFDHALDFCTMLPGPEAQQLATWCGFRLHGVRGGIAAGALFVLPGACLMALLSWASAAHADRALALHALWGAKAVVAGLVAVAVVQLARRVVRRRATAAIALAAFAALALGAPFPLVVPAAATLGLLALPATAGERIAHAPPDAHGGRPARALAVGAGLWLLPWLLLLAGGEAFALLRQLYLFFSVAALVTFGGAYAVLAYVADAAVHAHGWLTTAQALDGIALAEATPGPLVLALQHVAFVAVWNQPGASAPLAMALLAATIAAWTTFLPGMTCVLAGAPLLERLRARPRARAALAGVTGAALGALLQLALGILAATLRPAATGFDAIATAIAALAFVAVASRRLGVLAAMALGVAAGLLRAALA
jgi:chromate transporter